MLREDSLTSWVRSYNIFRQSFRLKLFRRRQWTRAWNCLCRSDSFSGRKYRDGGSGGFFHRFAACSTTTTRQAAHDLDDNHLHHPPSWSTIFTWHYAGWSREELGSDSVPTLSSKYAYHCFIHDWLLHYFHVYFVADLLLAAFLAAICDSRLQNDRSQLCVVRSKSWNRASLCRLLQVKGGFCRQVNHLIMK